MRRITLFFFLLLSKFSFGQSLNDYNKAIIAARFVFQKVDNQYRINTTVKAFLNSKGIEAYIANEKMPEGFHSSKCNKIYVDALEENTMFLTKIKFVFKDCFGTVLFTTDLGQSREKEYALSYNLASIEALKTFDKAKYVYSGKNNSDKVLDESKSLDRTISEPTILTDNSYKVKDKVTNTELVLYKTSKPEFFLTTFRGRNGVVLSNEGKWFFEYVDVNKVVTEELDIKFQ